MNNDTNLPLKNPPLKVARLQRLGVYATVIGVALLVGFVPMWLVARTRANERDAVQHALRLAHLENLVADAAIQSRRGDYEPSREAASAFYTKLRAGLDGSEQVFSPSQHESMQPLLARRDQLITLLARADPAAVDALADLYISYRQAAGTLAPRRDGPR